jgi:hypothetical protein
MTTFRLRTPFGTETDPTPERIAETLRATDLATDAYMFAVVERDDGVFVQLAPDGSLEVGGSGPMPHRLDHAALALQIVERLRRREDPWGNFPHRDLAIEDPRAALARRRSRVYVMIMLLAFAIFAAVLYWLVLR